ncbi:MAG: CAP domain-containing protein [Pseudomonadota bacterium]
MLRKYDTLKSSLLLALAAAGGAAVSGLASAGEVTCNLENGFATELATYVAEAETCIAEADNIAGQVADGLFAEINAERIANGLEPLNRRVSLDMAAEAHALDMSVRIFADHADLEGRDHLHRIRAFDRTMLVGASGSNVTVSKSSIAASDVHVKIKNDAFNAENILRDSFTDVGIGVVEKAGQFYVVQVFADAEGDLSEPLPIIAEGTAPLRVNLASRDQRFVGWGLMDDASGEVLARGSMPRLRFTGLEASEASLNVLVGLRNDTYVLKGPLVTGQPEAPAAVLIASR